MVGGARFFERAGPERWMRRSGALVLEKEGVGRRGCGLLVGLREANRKRKVVGGARFFERAGPEG